MPHVVRPPHRIGVRGQAGLRLVGNVGDGLGHNFCRAVENEVPRPIQVEDYSNLTLALALQAGAWGVPYMPTLTALGPDRAAYLRSLGPTRQEILAVEHDEPAAAVSYGW